MSKPHMIVSFHVRACKAILFIPRRQYLKGSNYTQIAVYCHDHSNARRQPIKIKTIEYTIKVLMPFCLPWVS